MHEGVGDLAALESAGVRPCCYRLLLPVGVPKLSMEPDVNTTASSAEE